MRVLLCKKKVIGILGVGLVLFCQKGWGEVSAYEKWDSEVIALARSLPVQEEGRVKPLDTYARFKLLKFNGKRSLRIKTGEGKVKISAIEWLMDCLFRPELARGLKVLVVDNTAAMRTVGLDLGEGAELRARFSYEDLLPVREELLRQADLYAQWEPKKLSKVQEMVLYVGNHFRELESLLHYLDFARHYVLIEEEGLPAGYQLSAGRYRMSDLLPLAGTINRLYGEMQQQKIPPQKWIEDMLVQVIQYSFRSSLGPALIPPSPEEKTENTWFSVGSLLYGVFEEKIAALEKKAEQVRMLEELCAARENGEEFKQIFKALHSSLIQVAQDRGEYSTVEREVFYYQANFIFRGLVWFLLGFLCAAFQWLFAEKKKLFSLFKMGTWICVGIGWLLLVSGIVLRCLIQGRPPITNLYETILFVTAVSTGVALIMEWINRRHIALSLAALLGTIGLFLSIKFEVKDGQDTMQSLRAVLDTNFWLSTHVTTITIGYAAGILAAAIANVFVLARFFRIKYGDREFYRSLTGMVYGVVCFALLFSLVGTVLGGIWANDSWGRFWGWDPKENGALMIVLWNLAILHARMGGYIRQFGLHLAAIIGGMIVGFSWWGVNLLGVGLHSYGFTDGVWTASLIFWGTQMGVILLGMGVYWRERGRAVG